MITFYVRLEQLNNFIDLREPVRFIPQIIGDDYVKLTYPVKDVIIRSYRSHVTIELRKKLRKRGGLWQKIKSIRKKN